MYRTWLIFWHTYWGHITRPAYLAFVFGLPIFAVVGPLLIGLIGFLVISSALPETNLRPVGLVDDTQSTIFLDTASYPDEPVSLQRYESQSAAAAALELGEIQGYYHITADYWENGQINASYDPATPFSPEIANMFERWVRRQLRTALPEDSLIRYQQGANITQASTAGEDSFDEEDYYQWAFLFGFIYFVRLAGMFTGGHMFGAISSESRNRTIEIILTSVSTVQFVTGKVIGLICVGLTQLAVWGSLPFVFMVLISRSAVGEQLQSILQWEHLWLAVSMLFGAYLLDQLVGAASGILRVSGGAGPQLFNLISWATSLALLYAGYFVPRNPQSPLAIITSFLPFTSPIVLLTRLVSSEVPFWQIVVSQVLLWATLVIFVLWLAHLVRKNMVSHPERFSLRRWAKAFIVRWPVLNKRFATANS